MAAAAAIAPIMSGLSGVVGAFGSYQAGNYAAAQSKRAAEVGRVQADQIDASYRDELNSTLANIKAIRSSAGVGSDSPTGQAVEAGQVKTSNRDRIIDVGSKRMQANQDDADAKFRRSSAKMSLIGGVAKSLPSFFGA